MKHILSPLAGIAVLAAVLSCSEERIGSNTDGMVHGITVTGTDFVYGDDTRAAYTVDNSGFHFTWTAGDTVGIYPVGADQVAFPISSGDGSQTAQFDGGAWALRADRQYAAYYPYDVWNTLRSSNSIPVSYIGQTQSGNASTAHLDRYDYMASAAVRPDMSGCVNITMKHLGSFVRFQLTMPQADSYTRLTLTDSGSGFVTTGTYDLSSQTPAIKSADTSKTISMDLKNVSTTSAGQTITLYMMLAPGNMSGHTISLALSGKTGFTYKSELDGKDFQPGKAYSYSPLITSGTNIIGEEVSWADDDPSQPLREYVDLGLSVKWATCNIGASKPEEYGDYFAWGETEPLYQPGYAQEDPQSHWKSGKSNGYRWSTYKYCKGSYYTMTKYCNKSSYGYNGYTDSKTVLDPEDDAAHVNWGGSWRMPTRAEQDELLTNCTWTWTTINGINGFKVQSNKSGYTDRWIFLPAAGFRDGTNLSNVGSLGYYWSSSLDTSYPSYGCYLNFYSGKVGWYGNYRDLGQSVRPVFQSDNSVSVSGVSLNRTSLSLNAGESAVLTATVTPSNATNKSVTWTSSNPSVATVDADGNVKAIKSGSTTVTVKTADGSHTASCTITVTSPVSDTHEYVDLGLSVKWATCNVGASKPEEYGDYFAWGATEPLYQPGYAQENPQSHWKSGKSGGYNWVNTPYQTANTTDWPSTKWTKYLGSTSSSYKDPSATNADALKIVLDLEDDAAHVNWGGSWRMSTKAEQDELRSNCTWTWTTINGIEGYKVQSNKSGYTDRWIFLPAAGYRYDTYLSSVGSNGGYWSSSLYTSDPYDAYYLGFYSGYYSTVNIYRYFGRSVRPVCQ